MQYNTKRSDKVKTSNDKFNVPSNAYKQSSTAKEYGKTDNAAEEKKNPPCS